MGLVSFITVAGLAGHYHQCASSAAAYQPETRHSCGLRDIPKASPGVRAADKVSCIAHRSLAAKVVGSNLSMAAARPCARAHGRACLLDILEVDSACSSVDRIKHALWE